MIKITEKQLIDWNACKEGIFWFKKHKTTGLRKLIHSLLKDDHPDYARWLLKHFLTGPQLIQWAIYSAELVLPNFESAYPADTRPRQAIQAAKDYLSGKRTKSGALSTYSAAFSVYSGVRSAAESAARSAAWSAAAWSAAGSAAWSAAGSAAESAARSAALSAGLSAAGSAVNKKIMNYALTLLGE